MPCTDIPSPDFRQKYRNLKRKLKILIYENECFQEELKKAQRKYLRVSRDKSFLLERLLQYEPVEETTSDSEATVSSDSEAELKVEMLALKKKKTTPSTENTEGPSNIPGASSTPSDVKKKKSRKLPPAKPVNQQGLPPNVLLDTVSVSHGDGHMTSEEIERHLESKQALRDLMPEKTPLTVPVDIFSNDPSGAECDINGQVTASSPNVAEGVSEDDGLIIDLHE